MSVRLKVLSPKKAFHIRTEKTLLEVIKIIIDVKTK